MKIFSKIELNELLDALYFMNMAEIKAFCKKHRIPASDKKGPIIDRIKHYFLTGTILIPKAIPAASIAEKGKNYPLTPNTRILKGAYKNDLKTRKFLKSLVGEHFHFTAAGQDWIMERWKKGKPPTYSEFAQAWQKEYFRRKNTKANPKQEWAYLNFLQRFQKENPKAAREEMTVAWEKVRREKAQKAIKILSSFKSSKP